MTAVHTAREGLLLVIVDVRACTHQDCPCAISRWSVRYIFFCIGISKLDNKVEIETNFINVRRLLRWLHDRHVALKEARAHVADPREIEGTR